MLLKYEPFLTLVEICLSTIPIYFALKQLKRYIQYILNLNLTSNGTNKKMTTVVIITIIQWCLFIRFLQTVYYPTFQLMEDKVDVILASMQSIYKYAHLLHFYVAFDGMVTHLKIVERNLKSENLRNVFGQYCKVFEMYEALGNFYQFYMSFIFLGVFYDTLAGVKRLEDFLFNQHGVNQPEIEAFTIFWCFFHAPLLMLVLHEGNVFHQKVFYLSMNS